MWKGLKDTTNYKTLPPSTLENQQLADDFNEFYCRFGKTPHTRPEHLSTQPLIPPATPSPPHLHWKQVKMTCARSSERTKGKHQDQTVCHQPALKPVLTSWPPSSQRSSTDHWSCAKSPHDSNALPSSPSKKWTTDDTTLIGLIQNGDESAYRREVKELAVWCSLNNLELNTIKTVKMIVDFRRTPPPDSIYCIR